MKLSNGEITFKLTMESLAYLLVNEVNRGEFLGLLVRMAEISADSSFEWEVIEHLFDRLAESDFETAAELLNTLALRIASKEGDD